tara:strand:+ start:3480 stop:3815 length:336 start_codon:yes stop_codon:yes gene_type:complete
MNDLILANGKPITLTSYLINGVGNSYTELVLHHCSLYPDTTHIKLLEIISPSERDKFLYYQSFEECAVRATDAQLELFMSNISDFTLISRKYNSQLTDDPKIYSKFLLYLL